MTVQEALKCLWESDFGRSGTECVLSDRLLLLSCHRGSKMVLSPQVPFPGTVGSVLKAVKPGPTLELGTGK